MPSSSFKLQAKPLSLDSSFHSPDELIKIGRQQEPGKFMMKSEVQLFMSHSQKSVSRKQQADAVCSADAMSELRPRPAYCKARQVMTVSIGPVILAARQARRLAPYWHLHMLQNSWLLSLAQHWKTSTMRPMCAEASASSACTHRQVMVLLTLLQMPTGSCRQRSG